MYIKNLSLRNFKCFEKVDVRFSKITLLTGPNSSGKSSLMYGLLGPLQSAKFPFYLSPNGKYVNMGDYTEMVFNNLRNRELTIDMVIGGRYKADDYRLSTAWIPDKPGRMPKLSNLKASMLSAKVEISGTRSGAYILRLNYDPKKYFRDESSVEFIKTFYQALQMIKLPSRSKKKKTLKGVSVDLLKPSKIKGQRFVSLDNLIDRVHVVNQLLSFIPFMKRNINFVSSFRLQPDRTYYQVSQAGKKVGKYGENYVDQILEWEKRKSKQFHELNSSLRQLKLLFSLKSRKLAGGRFELRVKVKGRGVWALITDVGFGISQFLPVLVADLQLPPTSTLFVAQPEIHLHPSIQAALADYFVKQANVKRKRYIIETHSEYLLNRIRLAIVKQELQPADLSVCYFDNTPAGSQMYPIEFTKDGQISNAPKSFFDTYMMDVMDIALNAH